MLDFNGGAALAHPVPATYSLRSLRAYCFLAHAQLLSMLTYLLTYFTYTDALRTPRRPFVEHFLTPLASPFAHTNV